MGKQINSTVRKPIIDHGGQATNIAWKFPLPGFTQSQPIIVGDRAIQTCEPRTVLCIDMKTGKEIWRQELDPFKMIGLDDKAREEALLLESTAWALHALSKNRISNYSRLYGADTPENRVKWLAQFARMRTVLDKAA